MYSSNKRILSFDVRTPAALGSDATAEMVTIDGIGRISHTLQLPARRQTLSSLSDDSQEVIIQTEDPRGTLISDDKDTYVLLLDNSGSLGVLVEQWALEYTSKFVHAAGPKFYSTTIAQILGTVYVKKGLPEVSKPSNLIDPLLTIVEADTVALMLRVAAIAFSKTPRSENLVERLLKTRKKNSIVPTYL